MYSSLPSIPICNSLLQHLETGFLLSMYLLIFASLLLLLLGEVTSVVSDSVRPHRWQATRHLCPWDSPGKNTGVGCHFLLQCMKVKSESEVAQSCPILSDPMDWSLRGSSIHGIFQARVLEWGAIAFSVPQAYTTLKGISEPLTHTSVASNY